MEANARPLSRGFSSLVRVVFFVRKNGKKREKRERTSNGRHWHHWHHWDHSWQILTDSDRFLPEFESWSSWDLCQSRELEVKMEEGVKRQVQARDFEMLVKCLWNVMSWFVIYHNHIYIYIIHIIVYHCVSLCISYGVSHSFFCMFFLYAFYVMPWSFSRCCEGLQEKLQQLLEAKADDLKLWSCKNWRKIWSAGGDLVRPWCGHGWTGANGW